MSACIVQSADELAAKAGARVCAVAEPGTDLVPYAAACAQAAAQREGAVRVVCANRVSVPRLEALLADVPGAEVLFAGDLALSVLADPRAQEATGRAPRVLDAAETDVLMEDLKVSGMKQRRLREMLKFFYKSFADCAVDYPKWLIAPDEQVHFALLEENLEARRALIPYETAYRAVCALRAVPDAVEALPCVVEDYGALSKAAQQLVAMTCDGSLTVIGSNAEAPAPDEPYPHFAGLAACDEAAGFAQVAIAARGTRPQPTVRRFPLPSDEFAGVAEWAAGLVEGGATPDDVLVAVPNATWGAQVKRALDGRGIGGALLQGPRKPKGDPRKPESCGELKLRALAKLLRDPDDFTALRSWLGLGDWLVRSDAFLELLAYAREHEMPVAAALSLLRADADEAAKLRLFGKIAQALDELDALRGLLAGADAATAAEALAAHGMRLPDALVVRAFCPDALAAAVLDEPQPETAGRVRIVVYEQVHGHHAPHAAVCGLAGGFLPKLDALDDAHTIDHKRKALARDRRLFDDLCAAAGEELLLTAFETDSLENAGVLPMHVQRIFMRRGRRMAHIEPSPFLED